MGACFSTAEDTAGSKAPVGPAPHDSAKYSNGQYHHAKATAAGAGTTAATTNKNTLGAKQQQQQQQQLRNDRRAKIDLATGEVIPDFSVHGSFDVLHELGSGGSGRTFLCRDMATSKVVAVKFVPRPLSKAAIPFMLNEVEVQANLGEPCLNIIYLYEIILTRTHLALVMEYASGGCLTNEVSCLWESALSRGGLFMGEQEASYYMRQFVQAMLFCHKNKVAHRDLKLDNTLLEKQLVGPHRIKLCDFGFAKQWSGSNSHMDTAIGTPVYMSPQMLASRQCASGYSGEKADIWASGILLFVMLLGTFPFDHDLKHDPNSGEAAGEVWLKQQQGSWRQHPKAADVVKRRALSADCCQLLDQLLEMDEEKRICTSQLVHHPWLSLPLSPEQQLAWEALQDEQQKLTDQLEAERDPRLVKIRKEAMLAMMAVAAKAPSATLFPGPNGEYASSHHSTGMGQSTALGSAAGNAQSSAYSQLLDDAGCPDQAADHAADQHHHQQGADIPPASPSQHSHKQQSELMVNRTNVPDTSAPVMPAASACAAEAADVPEEYEGWDDTTAVSDAVGSLTSLAGDSRHLSFFSGQGLRSTSLEEKVDRYRQQSADIRAARIAAMAEATAAGSQTQQQPPGADPKLQPAGNCASDAVRGADSAHNAGGCAVDGTTHMTSQPQVSPHATDTVAGKPHKKLLENWKRKHNTVSSEASNEQQCGQREGSAPNSPSTVDLAIALTGNAVGGAAAGAVAPEGVVQEDVDELWRLPLSTTVDPSVFKLSPELVVAAGALIRQLQGSSKVPGRGRTNRSSCPM